MRKCAAKQGDRIVSEMDLHWVVLPSQVHTLMPHRFDGPLRDELSPNVYIMDKRAAVVGSVAKHSGLHTPAPPGTRFSEQRPPPSNMGSVTEGSGTVFINNKRAARNRDKAQTCGHPDAPSGFVIASGSVYIG